MAIDTDEMNLEEVQMATPCFASGNETTIMESKMQSSGEKTSSTEQEVVDIAINFKTLARRMNKKACNALKEELKMLYNTHESHHLVKIDMCAKYEELYKESNLTGVCVISACEISLGTEMVKRALTHPFLHLSFQIDYHTYEVLIAASM